MHFQHGISLVTLFTTKPRNHEIFERKIVFDFLYAYVCAFRKVPLSQPEK